MSSTGSKAIQIAALVVGVILVVVGVRQCTNKNDQVSTAPGTTPRPTVVDESTTTTTARAATPTSPLLTTTTITRTTLAPINGTFAIVPAGKSFGPDYPYPADPAQPGVTPIIDWNITVAAGQKVEIRGPAPGTAEATLSGGTKGQFVPCPAAIQDGKCNVTAGSFTYTAVVLDGGAIVASKTAVLQVGAAAGPGGAPGGGGGF